MTWNRRGHKDGTPTTRPSAYDIDNFSRTTRGFRESRMRTCQESSREFLAVIKAHALLSVSRIEVLH
jgi:hypothetical protein